MAQIRAAMALDGAQGEKKGHHLPALIRPISSVGSSAESTSPTTPASMHSFTPAFDDLISPASSVLPETPTKGKCLLSSRNASSRHLAALISPSRLARAQSHRVSIASASSSATDEPSTPRRRPHRPQLKRENRSISTAIHQSACKRPLSSSWALSKTFEFDDSLEQSPQPAALGQSRAEPPATVRTRQRRVTKRMHIINELVATERRYCALLDAIHTHFYQPLLDDLASSRPESDKLLPRKALLQIFSSSFDEIRGLAHAFLACLDESTLPTAQRNDFGRAIIRVLPYFKCYASFVRGFDLGLERLESEYATNEAWRAFADSASGAIDKDFRLDSMLLAVVQRVPRYRLLLRDLLDCVPTSDPECCNLVQAVIQLEEVTQYLDQQVSQAQHSRLAVKLHRALAGVYCVLTPGRWLVKQGTLFALGHRERTQSSFYLFNDVFICATLRSTLGDPQPGSTLQFALDLDTLVVTCTASLCFEIFSVSLSVAVEAASASERDNWVSAIREAQNELLSSRRSLSKPEQRVGSAGTVSDEVKVTARAAKTERAAPVSSGILTHIVGNKLLSDAMAHLGLRQKPRLHILEHHSPPIWLEDSKADHCLRCLEPFGLFRRRHHCRSCGLVVCGRCSTNVFGIVRPGEDVVRQERACDPCYEQAFPNSPSSTSRAMASKHTPRLDTSTASASTAAQAGLLTYVLPAGGLLALLSFNKLKHVLTVNLTGSSTFSGWLVCLAIVLALALSTRRKLEPLFRFAWSCFLQPLGKHANQQQRLDKFYQSQADVYDSTRGGLLRGRHTMLKLAAASLKEQRKQHPRKRLVWVDIGGGTGWNIEEMDKYMPIHEFDAVHLIDLCEPLLEVARKRFERRGWKNVHVHCQDATAFSLPDWQSHGNDPIGSLDYVSMSYSLSMIPNFYAVLDRVERFLHADGLFSVCDFYVSARDENRPQVQAVGDTGRQVGLLSRLFWLNWFSFDHVDLNPLRRDYLEYRFGTLKSLNGRNRFPVFIPFCAIPYYVWLGCKANRDTSRTIQAFEVESGNTVSAASSPVIIAVRSNDYDGEDFSLGQSAMELSTSSLKRSASVTSQTVIVDIGAGVPYSSCHYQLTKTWRLPYLHMPIHNELKTFIYSFTWEDPAVDMQHLDINSNDTVMCVTSAGDNALHYAIAGKPRRIHCVDMNPCQGHLLELKLAAICALSYEEFWQMFGDGKFENFREVLDTRLSPLLSSHAYQFWRLHNDYFDQSLYMQGYAGHALRLGKYAFKLRGLSGSVERFCNADTLAGQRDIWETKLRPALLGNSIVKACLNSPVFQWRALGVPINQAQCYLRETTTAQFAADTLDPVARKTHVKSENYHYYLCLMQKYNELNPPLYLSKEGFKELKRDSAKALDTFRLHTDSIINVLKQLEPASLSVCILMDHMDWYTPNLEDIPGSAEAAEGEKRKVYMGATIAQSLTSRTREPCQLLASVKALKRVLKADGKVYWRSAGRDPWYRQVFEREGFVCTRMSDRIIGGQEPVDRVNMYASAWLAQVRK
ncbi:uncharacterized protein L969DRAFT_92001 [Mixia osmundae IAM 14324]|uniref:FYVE-type domain-containing protein n=1 Tax=Mixia osmundae (strain CBS 9802 / IAM 14324 / JCM 22182 / KY 12970) TaxID=764103 RepID=G7E2W9_MIXOS|nr:uncharacterized protein L969DRAFT_92001 [Mixia osmundae IAM 14324]KEI42563.1 hypothetical protein L969DRAFT_92001 [Mixia osmundae IAM 14324]GAA97150.1 hypothetical protein E5Q_03825 [Mixia osmundae IAM 14324]